jgi:hypothetical protein
MLQGPVERTAKRKSTAAGISQTTVGKRPCTKNCDTASDLGSTIIGIEGLSPERICGRCRDIGLDAPSQMKKLSRRSPGRRVCWLGTATSMKTASTTCKICSFLLDEITIAQSKFPISSRYQLRMVPARHVFDQGAVSLKDQDQIILCVTGEHQPDILDKQPHTKRYILPLSQSNSIDSVQIAGRQLDSARIDYTAIRSWIQFCDDHHKTTCGQANTIKLPGFKVMDCSTHEIVLLPSNCNYVALSYVWGTDLSKNIVGGGTNEESNNLSDDTVPQVVLDAIIVTHELGIGYLWVDRYCINQNNEREKEIQVRNMDSIYTAAVLTIIAAACDNPSFGLPGVSSVSRPPQTQLQLRDSTMVFADRSDPIKDSKWATRGWTYQEGLLSRRRLVFSRLQVYFECLNLYCFESISTPLRGFQSHRPSDKSVGGRVFPAGGLGAGSLELENRIWEYLPRELTYDSDQLMAFQGVLHAYERAQPATYNIWAVPIFPIVGNSPSIADLAASFCFGLLWKNSRAMERRKGFPSWSWVGWNLPKENRAIAWPKYALEGYGPTYKLPRYSRVTMLMHFELDGRRVAWEDIFETLKSSPLGCQRLAPYIHITTWTTAFRFELTKNQSGSSWHEADGDCKHYLSLTKRPETDPSLQRQLQEGSLLGFVVFWDRDRSNCRQLSNMIIVIPVGPDHYEKIGSLDICWSGKFPEEDSLGDALQFSIGERIFTKQTFVFG